MKVTFIWRGPSPYRVNFFNELGKYCDLTVLFEMRPEDISDKNIDWFKENSVTAFKAIYLKGYNVKRGNRLCPDVFKYVNLFRNSDIVVIGMYSTLTQMAVIPILKLLKIPYVINSDGGFVKKDNSISKFIKTFFIGNASAYLSSGRKTNEYLEFYGAKDNIFIYPFTSSLRKDVETIVLDSDKSAIKRQLGIKEEVVILFTGQFIHRKGIDILLKACKGLPDICGIYIVGGTPNDEYLKLVKDLNLRNIHFIGFKKPSELKHYYQSADIYVLPTREDIWGLVINEAMAFGLPVVTTYNCIAGVELIEDGINGYLCESEDYKELNIILRRLIDAKQLREQISISNRKKIKEYTIENMAKVHIEIFSRFAQNKK